MLLGFLIFLHVVVCILLIIVVLLQASKGGGLSGAFGGLGTTATTILGGRGTATFLSKATSVLAALFMLLCLAIVFSTGLNKPTSAVQEELKKSPANQAGSLPSVPVEK